MVKSDLDLKSHGHVVCKLKEHWDPTGSAWRLATWVAPRAAPRAWMTSHRKEERHWKSRHAWREGRKWGRATSISSPWLVTSLLLSFREETYGFIQNSWEAISLGVSYHVWGTRSPLVFSTFLFYLAAIVVEEVPGVSSSKEWRMKEVAR